MLVLSGSLCSAASGQTTKEEAFAVTVEMIQAASKDRKAALFDRYAGAVERLQADFQNKGDLAHALEARREAAKARESLAIGNADFPGIAQLREILKEELAKIEPVEQAKIDDARRKYVDHLRKRVRELTKAGDLDEASRLSAEQKKMEAQLADSAPAAETEPAPSEPSGELKQGEVLFGKVTLSGGSHRLRDELQIGKRKDNIESEKGFLTVKDRAEISRGAIWVNFGALVAENARFEGVALKEELQGRFTATKSLFENCTFSKKGGWMVAWFGTKWELDQCAIHDSFFPEWTNSKMGLKITNCTFIDVDFPSFQMRPGDRDAVWQSQHEWRTIEKCRFVECEIPVSVLLATEDCVFVDCKFVEDDIPETQELLSAPADSMKVRVYYSGIAVPEIPSPSPKLKFDVKSATSVQENWGCPPFYIIGANELQFR